MSNELYEALVGIILYDIKNKETLGFNLESLSSYKENHAVAENELIYDVIKYLFVNTINDKLEVTSNIPFPIDSPYYAALPWICYSVISPIAIDNPSAHSPNRILSIPEFFIFGHITSPEEETSFVFNNFSADKQGRALCIMNLNENDRHIKYTLRFDQSAGEPLIHVDYSYYDKSEIKLIAHKILNFEEIYRFSTRLFIAIMIAGIFDAYFSTLVKGGIKGLTELAKQNPAFLYPYYWLWMIEEFTMKLNVRQDAYRILKKLYEGVSLEQDEKVFIKNIEYGHFSVTAKDEQGSIIGLSRLGYAVLMRYRRGQNTIRAT